MESAEIIVDNIELTDGIRLETETAQENNLVLNAARLDTDRTSLDAGDKILLEDTGFGKFQRGEIVTGSSSNATATVLTEDLDINDNIFNSSVLAATFSATLELAKKGKVEIRQLNPFGEIFIRNKLEIN